MSGFVSTCLGAAQPTHGNVVDYDTVDSLLLANPQGLTTTYVVRGLHAANDGNGGAFYYDSASVVPADGASSFVWGTGRLLRLVIPGNLTPPITKVDGVTASVGNMRVTNSLSVNGLGSNWIGQLTISGVFIDPRNPPYGAKVDGTTDDSAAYQAALNAIVNAGGGTLLVPGGTSLISTPLTVTAAVNQIALQGTGFGNSFLKSGITGNGAASLLTITCQGVYYHISGIHFIGNSQTGAGGNGHALSLINTNSDAGTATFWPQSVCVDRCVFEGFRGTGVDHSGASMPAAGIYEYGGLGDEINSCRFYQDGRFAYIDSSFETRFIHCVGSACDYTCIYLRVVNDSEIRDCTLVGAGSGNADDGCIFATGCTKVTHTGGYAKNGNPWVDNFTGTTVINDTIAIKDVWFAQLDTSMTNTIIGIGSGNQNVLIEGNHFLELNAWTNAVDILVYQGVGGSSVTGTRIANNEFVSGQGCVTKACIWINVANNYAIAPVIEHNVFGTIANQGATTYIGDCIRLENNVLSPLIRANCFLAGNGTVITNVCNVVSPATISGMLWEQNQAFVPFGTTGVIVNTNANTQSIVSLQDGILTLGSLGGTLGLEHIYSGTLTSSLVMTNNQMTTLDVPVSGAMPGDLPWQLTGIDPVFGDALTNGVITTSFVNTNHVYTTIYNLTGSNYNRTNVTWRSTVVRH